MPRPEPVSALPDPPAFGSFVRVGAESGGDLPLPLDFDPFETPPAYAPPPEGSDAPTLYAVVFYAETGALESGRALTAFGLDEDTLRREQPHIYELLATRFSAALVAHAGADGVIRSYLPPRPPRPHARVWAATDDETRRLTTDLGFLRSLLAGGVGGGGATCPPDELVAAVLRGAWRAWNGDEAFLHRAGGELATLLAHDYDRLRALLNHITGKT